jgi:hypothetical protein
VSRDGLPGWQAHALAPLQVTSRQRVVVVAFDPASDRAGKLDGTDQPAIDLLGPLRAPCARRVEEQRQSTRVDEQAGIPASPGRAEPAPSYGSRGIGRESGSGRIGTRRRRTQVV